jgi:hypothetical protein
MLYIILAAGFPDVALVLAFGHAALRMQQMLRAVNFPLEIHHLTGALEYKTEPKVVPEVFFRMSWRLNRMNSELCLPQVLYLFRGICNFKPLEFGRLPQWFLTSVLVVLAGMPFSPLTQFNDQVLMDLLHTSPFKAVSLMVFFILSSTILFWFVMAYVLNECRFRHSKALIEKHGQGDPNFGVSNDPNFMKSQEHCSNRGGLLSNSLTDPLLIRSDSKDGGPKVVHRPQMGA